MFHEYEIRYNNNNIAETANKLRELKMQVTVRYSKVQ